MARKGEIVAISGVPGTSAISPLDLLAGHPANRTEQGASAHALVIRHSKADEMSMNHHRRLDCCLRIVSAQTRSAAVGKSAAQFSRSCSTRMTARALR